MSNIPTIVKAEVFPVAGHDCMELNLSGAHAPYFTRNVVILTDSNGVEGVGEVPGGQKITAAIPGRMNGIDTHWIWQEGRERLHRPAQEGRPGHRSGSGADHEGEQAVLRQLPGCAQRRHRYAVSDSRLEVRQQETLSGTIKTRKSPAFVPGFSY